MALDKIFPMVFLFFIGLIFKRMKVLKKEQHAPLISQLILYIALPSTIINAISAMEISLQLLVLPICGLAIVTTLLGAGLALAPLMGLPDKTRGTFIMAFPSLELGSIGYAYMSAVYGPTGLSQIVLLDAGNRLFFFTVVVFLASVFGQRFQPGKLLDVCFFVNPVILSFGVGIAFNILHIHVALLSNLFLVLSQMLLPLIMLLLAAEFELQHSSLSAPLNVYLKWAIGVAVGTLISLIFGLSGMTRTTVILAASMPSSLLTMIYAKKHGLDTQYLASMLSLALPVSLVLSPLLIFFTH